MKRNPTNSRLTKLILNRKKGRKVRYIMSTVFGSNYRKYKYMVPSFYDLLFEKKDNEGK